MGKRTVCTLVFLCCCGFCVSQQLVSTGGYAVKPDVSVNWILGGSLSDLMAVSPGILNRMPADPSSDAAVSMKVYPVPASDFVKIEISSPDTGRMVIELISYSGSKVLSKSLPNKSVNELDIKNLPPGVYYVKVYGLSGGPQLVKTEMIIKK